ncbi:MAG: hypothetical protein KDD28_15445 [Phaeodactylibacter sp.]|nr:hypothetical protein [Phaeodactylibacter sp.]HQU61173.1 hypothetical protein [Saprospiraceae bacterium]
MTDIELIGYLIASEEFEPSVKVGASYIIGAHIYTTLEVEDIVRIQSDTNRKFSIRCNEFKFERTA